MAQGDPPGEKKNLFGMNLPVMNYDWTLLTRIPDYSAMSRKVEETVRNIRPPAQQKAESIKETITSHIKRLQTDLKEDEELLAYYFTGIEPIRVMHLLFQSWHLVILIGQDNGGNFSTAIMNIENVRLTFKVVKVKEDRPPVRIGFVLQDKGEEAHT